jgi:hypothetical protein
MRARFWDPWAVYWEETGKNAAALRWEPVLFSDACAVAPTARSTRTGAQASAPVHKLPSLFFLRLALLGFSAVDSGTIGIFCREKHLLQARLNRLLVGFDKLNNSRRRIDASNFYYTVLIVLNYIVY